MCRGDIWTCLPPLFMNWENECLKSSQGKPTWNCGDHKRALSVSLQLLPFPGRVPGAGVTGWRDGPDPPAVQVQCPDTHPCPAWWGWGWEAWVLLPPASFRVTQEEMLRAGLRGFFFFFWWKHSNPIGAVHMGTESPGSQALFWKSELVVVFG